MARDSRVGDVLFLCPEKQARLLLVINKSRLKKTDDASSRKDVVRRGRTVLKIFVPKQGGKKDIRYRDTIRDVVRELPVRNGLQGEGAS